MGVVKTIRRTVVIVVAVVVFTLVSIQFAHIVNENLAMARSLSSTQSDVTSLRERRRTQEREIRRLMDPEGAVPEIHERLHLTRPNEAVIYVKNPAPPRE
jgi:cell division protein FtsB